MACGAAVIGADATSIPEVIGIQEALFDPFDVDSLSSLMVKIINDENFRHFLQKHGLRQAKNFSWDTAGRRAIRMFERVAGKVKAAADGLQGDMLVHSLVRSIASLQCAMQFDVDECATIASAIATNHPAVDRKSILYVDVSELVQRDARTGVQRVTRSVLYELLNNPPEAYDVHPVYATTSLSGYRYAQKFTRQFLGLEVNGVEDLPIDPTMGDIFLA